MKKNENRTHGFLQELFPDVEIEHPYYIKEKIYDENNNLIRNYILVDFGIMVNGKQVLVEYNGSQHFRSVKKWGGRAALFKQKIRDKFLRDYCKINKIKLVEIDGRRVRGQRILSELKKRLRTIIKKAPTK